MADGKLYFGSTEIKAPTVFRLGNEKIWSQNTARTASGTMVGDIIGIKKTIHIEWANATPAETAAINSFISSIGNAFFDVTFLDETFTQVTKTVYAGTPSYEQWGWDERRQLCKVLTVDLIEQ